MSSRRREPSPLGHSSQHCLPASEANVPLAQLAQLFLSLDGILPAAQLSQLVLPTFEEYFPEAQAAQLALPAAAECFPSAQLSQSFRSARVFFPAGQSEQLALL